MNDITFIAQGVLWVLATAISAFVIPYLKRKLSREQVEELAKWISIAVRAAEQIYTQSGMGKEKKVYVLEFLYGVGVDVDVIKYDIDAMIEAAVYELGK